MTTDITMTIESSLTKEAVIAICRDQLPEFVWKFGDSEYQGFYVSGRLSSGGSFKCWPGEQPMELAVSFLGSVPEEERLRILNITTTKIVPQLGVVLSYLAD